jgi:Zn-dependent M28 family amino/carboxypeptidase
VPFLFSCCGCVQRSPVEFVSAVSIHRDIAYLASDDFAGRNARGVEGKLAAYWIAERFRAAGLSPVAGGTEFYHTVRNGRFSPNVIGMRKGRGHDFVIISAHYDHLGISRRAKAGEDRIYNGADDNASGVAGIIAIAGAMKAAKVRTDASIIFIAFTAEEEGLWGSRAVAEKPPFNLCRVRGVYNMDMISRGEEDLIFVDGEKAADPLRAALRHANETGKLGLRVKIDEHPDWNERSDHTPFIKKNVPAVLFSVEDHPDYHQVTDHADKILPKLAERVTKLVLLAATETANGKTSTTRPATQKLSS